MAVEVGAVEVRLNGGQVGQEFGQEFGHLHWGVHRYGIDHLQWGMLFDKQQDL